VPGPLDRDDGEGHGDRAKLTVKFIRGGRFPFLCTVTGHAKFGMKGVLIVR